MKIYSQLNDNDCGISVTRSLIEHFYKIEISREELIKNSNLNQNGLSIINLELLNEKYGIKLESYELSFEEFQKYKTDKYFILLLNIHSQNHFVIGKKYKKYVLIYDSVLGKTQFQYEQLKELFTGIFITANPTQTKLKIIPEKILESKEIYDCKKVLSLLLINICVFGTSLITYFLFKYIFQQFTNHFELTNIKNSILGITLIYLIFHFGEYLEKCISKNHKTHYSKSLYQTLLNSLLNKKNSYLQKLGKNPLLNIKTHIEIISSYHAEYINKWLISCLILTISSILIIQINPLFIILIIFTLIFQTYLHKYSQKIQNPLISRIIKHKNIGQDLDNKLENFLKNEVNISKLKTLTQHCSDNYLKELLYSQNLFTKTQGISHINNFLNNMLYVLLFLLIAIFSSYSHITADYWLLLGFLYTQINKSASSLIGYKIFKEKYNQSKKIYNQLLNVDHAKISNKTISLPPYIQINNLYFGTSQKIIFKNLNLKIPPYTLIYGPSGIGKTILYKLISGKISTNGDSIFFGNISLNSIEPSELNNSLIYQISDGFLSTDNHLSKILEKLCPDLKKQVLQMCKLMNINIHQNPENYSSGQKQFINILNLLQISNKILLLDEISSHINNKNRRKIFEILIPHIASKNFLICSEHFSELKLLFPNNINLENYVNLE